MFIKVKREKTLPTLNYAQTSDLEYVEEVNFLRNLFTTRIIKLIFFKKKLLLALVSVAISVWILII